MKFLLSEYSNFVKQLLEDGYECLPFSAPEARRTTGKNLLLRHDIDIDPTAALPMAKFRGKVTAFGLIKICLLVDDSTS